MSINRNKQKLFRLIIYLFIIINIIRPILVVINYLTKCMIGFLLITYADIVYNNAALLVISNTQ